ncbi:MAG: hypothetical protein R6V75_09165 [Bacteroidales bacterium]
MRRYCFLLLLFTTLPASRLHPQTAGCLALNLPDWASQTSGRGKGLGWMAFTRQYFSVSDWNASGAGLQWLAPPAVTSLLACRDGIAGFARYHLFVSHHHQAGPIDATLQLRFTWISARPQPLAFRLGANARITCRLADTALAGIELFDLPGWISPDSPLTQGDPRLKALAVFNPDERLALLMALELSTLMTGPLTGGVRVNLPGQLALEAILHLMPGGVGVGVTWNASRCSVRTLFDHHIGPGLTPTILVDYR